MSVTGTTSEKWPTRRLGDITRIRTGKLDANAQRPGGPYPFFTCGEEVLEIDHFAFDTEAVLLAGNGNFNVKWYHGKFNAYQRTYVIEPNGVYGKWLFYAIQAALRTITRGNRGSVIRFIRIGDIVDSTVCLPPADEQRRVVAEIEKQFTRLEAGVAALRRVQANLKRYRAAVLKAACEGKLVPTEAELAKNKKRKFETGAELLARILTERRQNWQGRGKCKEPATPDTANLPPVPEGWTWASVSALAELENGDRSNNYPSRSAFVSEGIPFINAGHLEHGKVQTDEMNYISEERFELLRAGKTMIGDILFCLRGSLGKVALVADIQRGAIASSLVIVRAYDKSLISYLLWYLSSWWARQMISRYDNGSAQPNLSAADLAKFAVPLPPLAEQTRIVAEVERRLSVVEELESVVTSNLARGQRLRQSILQRAFTGSL